jgi:hypothetical protein
VASSRVVGSTGDPPWVFDEYLLFGICRIERLCAAVPPVTPLRGQLASRCRKSVLMLPPRTAAGDCEALMNMPSAHDGRAPHQRSDAVARGGSPVPRNTSPVGEAAGGGMGPLTTQVPAVNPPLRRRTSQAEQARTQGDSHWPARGSRARISVVCDFDRAMFSVQSPTRRYLCNFSAQL